jgi:hypothetical protein
MAGSGQDNSSGAGSGKPVVRLRGFQNKPPEPPPSTPIIPPKPPNRPGEVRFKRSPSSQPPVEDVSPPLEASTPVEDLVPADALSPAEYPGETVEPYQEYPVEPSDQAYTTTVEETPVGPSDQAYGTTVEEAAFGPSAANIAPVEPPLGGMVDFPASTSFQEVVSKSSSPPVAGNRGVGGVRLRMPPKAAPATTEAPAASDPVGQSGARPEGSAAAPAGLPYRPDTDIERINRRQWWKYDLKVKSGREPAPGA